MAKVANTRRSTSKRLQGKGARLVTHPKIEQSKNNPRSTLICCAALATLTLALYSPAGHHPFVDYDDQVYVTDNAHIQSGLTAETIRWALSSTEESNWHPVTWISHALDVQFFGMNAEGHHWTNVLIHAVNVVLLF